MIPLMNNPSTIGNPVFSPDGKQIAFEFNTGGNLDIYLMDADGKNRHRITTNPADDGQPTFSPDGKYIAFVSRRDDNYELYMMDADGSNQRRLTYTLADEYDPVGVKRKVIRRYFVIRHSSFFRHSSFVIIHGRHSSLSATSGDLCAL